MSQIHRQMVQQQTVVDLNFQSPPTHPHPPGNFNLIEITTINERAKLASCGSINWLSGGHVTQRIEANKLPLCMPVSLSLRTVSS